MQQHGQARRRVLLLPCSRCQRRTPQEEFGCWVDVGEGSGGEGWLPLPIHTTGWHCYGCGRTHLSGLSTKASGILFREPIPSAIVLAAW